jgi:uncharacterized protein (TIGR04255 family)
MFKPANSEHAVSSVTFAVNFAEDITDAAIDLVRANHHLWRTHLPASIPGGAVNIEMTPDGPKMHTNLGVAHAFLRPDGTPAWMLRVDTRQISIHCTRYTRWEKVASQAQEHLQTVLNLLKQNQFSFAISDFQLTFLDEFYWHGTLDNYDLALLLKPYQAIADVAFSSGPVWHSHTAWFEQANTSNTLIHFNVDGTREGISSFPSDATARVALLNVQSTRPNTPMQINEVVSNLNSAIAKAMEDMHMRNKELLLKTLTPVAIEAINLK